MVKFYELRNSSKVIFGQNILNKIPNFKVEDIPLAEGARFLLNRMSHMVQFFYPSFLTKKAKNNEHQIFLLHAIKTYTDSCTALLILSRKYKPTYEERLNIFKETFSNDFSDLYKEIPEFLNKMEEFTDLKFNMNFNKYEGEDLRLWEESRNYIGINSMYFFNKFLNKKINNYYELSKWIRKSYTKYYSPYIQYIIKNKFGIRIKGKIILSLSAVAACMYMNFLYFNRIRKYHKKLYFRSLFKISPPELTFFSALPLILYSLKKNGSVDLKMLNKGKKILQKTYPVNIKYEGKDFEYWEKIAHTYSNAYILFAFLKII